ncbi:MAG TPA: DUF1634 domain-containing protein [Polyangiaceae bacterium]
MSVRAHPEDAATRAVEKRMAWGLQWGTWVGFAVVAIGLVVPHGTPTVVAGIGLFIALPVLRVAVMLVDFARRRDLRMAAVAAMVLLIILSAVALNLRG